jgi:transcriptional regulator with XRE-family HTH domain
VDDDQAAYAQQWATWLREQFDRSRSVRINADLVRAGGKKENGRPVIDASRVTAWLKGKSRPSFDLARRTAVAFGLPGEEGLRAAGYVVGQTPPEPAEVGRSVDIAELLAEDPTLSPESREHIINQYRILQRYSAGGPHDDRPATGDDEVGFTVRRRGGHGATGTNGR